MAPVSCKVCGTRLGSGERYCPNCGTESTRRPLADTGPIPLAPYEDSDADVEIDLDDSSSGELAPAPAEPREAPEKARPREASPAPRRTSAPLFTPEPASLRQLIGEQPALLEPGLETLREKGKRVGIGYRSAVGEIDLLATDNQGDFVVVMVAEKSQGGDIVADVLARVGWVRKHLATGEKVRGIVLCQEAPEDLSYTAAAVADTVKFKCYRVALSFEDIEI